MSRLLLTGGGGSIGIHVIDYFLQKTDWEIVVLDSFHHKGYYDRIAQLEHSRKIPKDRLRVFQHDLSCAISEHLKQEIGPIDYIFHLAAMSDVFFSVENPAFVIKNNVDSTITMLEYARTTPHQAFVYFSTDEVYGPVKKGQAHKEWDTHRPSNAYSASKAACEDICYAYWRSGWAKVIITNTMNNFGPMQSASKFPVMVQKAIEHGETVHIHGNKREIGSRFYIHSWDVADALHFILEQPITLHAIGEMDEPDRYHIVGSECLNNLELAIRIAELMGKEMKTELVDFHKDNPAHDIHYGLKDSKLRSLGWEPPLGFEKGMKETIAWQEKHRDWME